MFEDGGFLRDCVAAESMRLEGLVAAALPKRGQEAVGGSMTVTRWPEHSRHMFRVMPAMSRECELGVGRGVVLVLSPAQSRVAVGLAMRKTPAEIALESGRGL